MMNGFMEIERVVDLLNKGDHLKQSHKEILRDLEVTTFDKELLQKEKEGLYKENKQLKMHMKSVKAHLEGGKEDMTEKRFQVTVSSGYTVTLKEVEDYGTWEFLTISFKTFKDANDCAIALSPICNRLNAIYEDNMELNKLLDSVENIVQTSIHDEKTAFGSMVLKQLADKLGVDYD